MTDKPTKNKYHQELSNWGWTTSQSDKNYDYYFHPQRDAVVRVPKNGRNPEIVTGDGRPKRFTMT